MIRAFTVRDILDEEIARSWHEAGRGLLKETRSGKSTGKEATPAQPICIPAVAFSRSSGMMHLSSRTRRHS